MEWEGMMGTSQSSTGPNRRSALVPSWADDQPGQPLPPPDENRFRAFRASLGKFVSSGSDKYLKSAIGHYARTASGGGTIAARRLGSITKTGGALFGALTGNTVKLDNGKIFDITKLSGLPCESVMQQLLEALTPEDGDSEKIRAALSNALIEALDGVEVFDANNITDDILISIMINYLAESIFLQIVMDGGRSWNKAETTTDALRAEKQLRELVKVIVDKQLELVFSNGIGHLSQTQVIEIEKNAIVNVWTEWESFQ